MGREKRRRKPGVPHPLPLEDLFEAGEAALYGQVCWSIANHGTEMPTVGEVITLEGGYGEEHHRSRKFRITDESMYNVERCLGIKGCGEAVALFSDTEVEAAEPDGDCPHGHPEAAIEFMFHGIRPTEPCPDCGEIPEFGNTLMSPDLHPDGPVKAVDGREYTTCPECGGDVLQLEGSSIAEWGWKIVCLNCGWGMKLAESLDMAQYCDLMEEVKSRVESVNRLMEMPGLTIRPRVESVCLQLRMLLELIVFSSLVSNKDVWRRSRKELQGSRDLGKKLNELRRIHPNFYPQPVDMEGGVPGNEPVDRERGFLNQDRLMEVYGRLGNILHAENPMGKETDYGFFIDAVPGWLTEIVNLLECHKVYLYHRPQEFYLIKMFGDVDGELMPIRFVTTAEGETMCAWPDCVSWSARRYCEYIQRPWRQCLLPELEPAQSEGKRAADSLDDAVPRSSIPTKISRKGRTGG